MGVAGDELVAVTPADLLRHAGHLDTIAAGLDTAQQAGDQVRLDAGAYGKLCTLVPVLLGGLATLIDDGIATAGGSVRQSAGRVRAAAGDYQQTDQASADDLNRYRSGR